MENEINEILANFFLFINNKFPKSKIVIGSGVKGLHYTIHFGDNSGFIDIHKTNEITGDQPTLFKMKRVDFIKIIEMAKQYVPELFKKFQPRKINLAILNRNEWYCIPFYKTSSQLENMVEIRKNRFKFSKHFFSKCFLDPCISPNEIHNNEGTLFFLYDRKRKLKGTLMKLPKDAMSDILLFIRIEKYPQFMKESLNTIKAVIKTTDIDEKEILLKHIQDMSENIPIYDDRELNN